MYEITCKKCDAPIRDDLMQGECPNCGAFVHFEYGAQWTTDDTDRSMWKYSDFLPIKDKRNIVSLGEGNTPLIRGNDRGNVHVFLKDESRNPTGSMKDRAISVAYSKARELGIKNSIIVSAGGAGIAAAAYASKAGMDNYVLVPPGVSQERMMAMQIYGSKLIEVQGSIEDCLDLATEFTEKYGWYETTTYKKANPYSSEGPKTIAYELFEQMKEVPDYIFIPIGGGGTLTGVYQAYNELKARGKVATIPKLIGIQNSLFNGLEIAIEKGYTTDEELKSIEIDSTLPTVTGAIKHAYVPDGEEVLEAVKGSKGAIMTISDEEALEGQRIIAEQEGLFVEPSSAITMIALEKMIKEGEIQGGETAVLLMTGLGYREVSTTLAHHQKSPHKLTYEECYEFLLERSKQ